MHQPPQNADGFMHLVRVSQCFDLADIKREELPPETVVRRISTDETVDDGRHLLLRRLRDLIDLATAQ